jgi:hypothetical protein
MILAHKTDVGATREAYSIMNGWSIKIVGFCLGDGGHNPLTGNPIAVDRSVSVLPGLLYGTSYDVESTILDSDTIQVNCTLSTGQAIGIEMSDIGLVARIVTDDEDNGKEFLYAVANFPLQARENGNLTIQIKLNN